MNRSIRTLMTTAALAIGALGAGVANAAPDVYVPARPYPGSAPVTIYQERVYPQHAPAHVYDDRGRRYAYNDDRRAQRRAERCGAERWNPNERYMPGDVVWRNGELYRARGVSASAWNVNSPPEWTPNYWAPARCR